MAYTPEKTASTNRSAFVRGTHQFDIVGYSQQKALAGLSARNSSVLRSGDFEAGECTWALSCRFKKQGLASISLKLLVSSKQYYVVTAKASLRIHDPLRRRPAALWRSPDINIFLTDRLLATRERMRWKLPVPEAFLHGQEERYVVDDRLVILCAVDVLRVDPVPAKTRNFFVSAVPPPTISGDLLMLLFASRSKSDSVKRCMRPDVTFVVEEIEIHAHKLVLAMRSPVFAAEFRWHEDESSITRAVHDMSASTFMAMLRFIYTDEPPSKPNINGMIVPTSEDKYAAACYETMVRDLLVAADRYDLERLRLMCESILADSMDANSFMPTLMLVQGRYSCRQLEDSCIEYLASHPDVYTAVKATVDEEYSELEKSFLLEVADKVAMTPNSSSNNLPSRKRKRNNDLLEVFHGTHKFTIPYFRAVHRSLPGRQETIGSGTFQVGGYNWMLWFWRAAAYPFSSSKEVIVVCLQLRSVVGETERVTTSVNFRIEFHGGKSSPSINLVEEIFTRRGDSRRAQFTVTNSISFPYDECLTVHCHLTVTKKACTGCSTTTPGAGGGIIVPPSNISLHLEQLLVSGQRSDVRFLVEGCDIRAHRIVIAARSPVLYEAVMTMGPKEDDHHHIVRVDDMKAAVFWSVLHFIYTEKLPSMHSLVLAVEDMLAAACRFRLERMRIACQNFLTEHISQENAFNMLKLARSHHCLELQKYCVDFIST